MIVTRGLGQAEGAQSSMVTFGLGGYAFIVDDLGRIRIVRIVATVDQMDTRLEVLEAI